MMDTRGSFDSLSVDAVAAAKDGERQAKLHQQAEANVIRQKNTASLRGDVPKMPAPPRGSDLPPKQQQQQVDKKAQESASKAHARKIVRIQKYLTNPVLAPYLHGISAPKTWGTAEVDQTLEIIHDRLNSGMGSASVKAAWLKLLEFGDENVDALPPSWQMPRGANNYAAMRMNELNMEFEQLAIEYGEWFSAGPVTRLFGKTLAMLTEYRHKVNTGQLPVFYDPNGDIPVDVQQEAEQQMAATSGQSEPIPPQRQGPPAEHQYESTLPYDVPELPPPMKVYPDRRDNNASIVIGDREIPMRELQAANVAMKEEMPPPHLFKDPVTEPVFSSDDGAASSTGKKSGRGRGRPGKAGL
jgi:hypothetical protein